MLDYENFKSIEKKIILEENGHLEINNVYDIMKVINNIDINDNNTQDNANQINANFELEEIKEPDDSKCDDSGESSNKYKIPGLFKRLL